MSKSTNFAAVLNVDVYDLHGAIESNEPIYLSEKTLNLSDAQKDSYVLLCYGKEVMIMKITGSKVFSGEEDKVPDEEYWTDSSVLAEAYEDSNFKKASYIKTSTLDVLKMNPPCQSRHEISENTETALKQLLETE